MFCAHVYFKMISIIMKIDNVTNAHMFKMISVSMVLITTNQKLNCYSMLMTLLQF